MDVKPISDLYRLKIYQMQQRVKLHNLIYKEPTYSITKQEKERRLPSSVFFNKVKKIAGKCFYRRVGFLLDKPDK